jgi:hypothetical protein
VSTLTRAGLLLALLAWPRGAPAAPADLVAAREAVRAGTDVVAFDLPATPGAPHVRAATLACAPPATVLGVLSDPTHFRALLPSLVRSEEVARRGEARVVAWELEVPLFNLSGKMELRPLRGGVELALVEGDFAPGRVAFEVAPRAGGCATVTVDARLDVKRSSWFLRKVIARSPWGEPAALAAAAWTALRATALRAEHAGEAAAARPTAPHLWPAPGVPDGRALERPPLARLAARGAVAAIASAPTGRLIGVSVAVPVAPPASALTARLASPTSWRHFPGWQHVRPMPSTGQGPATVVVEDGIPFVDLDATWQPVPHMPLTWRAVDGAARGAWFGWQLSDGPAGAQAVLTLSPRLELTGSVPRRLIAAEPLLEHGLSLALAFVDAVSATRGGGAPAPAR